MAPPTLYQVTVGRDEYVGTAEEVVGFMARAQGAPAGGVAAYMRGIASRLRRQMGIEAVDVSSPVAFLQSLREAEVLTIEERREASSERVDPSEALGSGPVAFGPHVDPSEIDLDALE